MPLIVQNDRVVKVHTALDDNVLLFSTMEGDERLSTLFDYKLTLLSEDSALGLDDLLGTDITVELEMQSGSSRFFHGYVSQCAHVGNVDELARYEFSVRPWFWFFTRTADCRIFQDMSVPDIIKQVFSDEGFTEYEDRLTAPYEAWNYCVQYRETDYHFLSRLMEQEGIYYYFMHQNGSHKLILSDSYSAHDSLPGYEEVPYYPVDNDQYRERDHLNRWNVQKRLEPGRFVVKDFNFESPKGNMLADSATTGSHARADYEVYDYPGEYPSLAAGETVAELRKEASQAQHEVATGGGNVEGLRVGSLFMLVNHDRQAQNREYLVTQSRLSLSLEVYRSGSGSDIEQGFHCDIAAIDSNVPFRAPRLTPKPFVQGPQTAMVVGPRGEEIWTDEFGRVKLQFHWDRYGKSDENSSCWVRVSQSWAGQGWGSMHIPRIGHEVIVEFLEGDPDRPIITGRVYNGDNGVPYDLPANATQSGIKSRSSQSGTSSNFNEIRMEDKKGSEELYVHAEKNQTNIVENDESTSVGHDRSESVGHDETINIGNNRTEAVLNDEDISIGNCRSERVEVDESIDIGGNRSETVGLDENINIGSSRSVVIERNKSESVKLNKMETIGVAKELTIGGFYNVSVGANVSESYNANQSTTVASDHGENVGGSQSITIGKDQSLNVGKIQSTTVGEDQTLTIGKKLTIDVGDEITIKTGKASIVMKKDGTIAITGKDVSIKASGGITQKAGKNLVQKARKIEQN